MRITINRDANISATVFSLFIFVILKTVNVIIAALENFNRLVIVRPNIRGYIAPFFRE
jgi:hypothetical protein